ncbi:hypothetical protein ACFL5Q_02075 [Planctomycetota bacterium]
MRKQIVVESFVGATYFKCEVPWACISIATEEDKWPVISGANRVEWLQLAFADIRFPDPTCSKTVFDDGRARRILDFVKDVWDRIDLLFVHCEAGTSRSPAVAAAISRICYGDDGPFMLPHLYEPNLLVYRKLLEVAEQRGEYSSQ